MPDEVEWDAGKNATNLAKHGIGFDEAVRIFDDLRIERFDDRRDYGEVRRIAIGRIGDVHITVVYTFRGTMRRIISARRANRHREAYRSAYGD